VALPSWRKDTHTETSERNRWERTVPDLCDGHSVLKPAHHGRHDRTDARWLELVKPEMAVARVGRLNEYVFIATGPEGQGEGHLSVMPVIPGAPKQF
jgi:hypothetical protein